MLCSRALESLPSLDTSILGTSGCGVAEVERETGSGTAVGEGVADSSSSASSSGTLPSSDESSPSTSSSSVKKSPASWISPSSPSSFMLLGSSSTSTYELLVDDSEILLEDVSSSERPEPSAPVSSALDFPLSTGVASPSFVMGTKPEIIFVSSAFSVPKTDVRVCSGCFDSAASSLSSFVGVDGVDGFSGSRLSSPPVFNKSENDFFGAENEPKGLEEPLKDAKAPPVVLVGVGVGVAGVVGVKGDFAAPRMEGEPNAGVAVVEADILVLGGLMGENAETTGGVCTDFLKNGESVGVVLPKAPKPVAGLKEEGVV